MVLGGWVGGLGRLPNHKTSGFMKIYPQFARLKTKCFSNFCFLSAFMSREYSFNIPLQVKTFRPSPSLSESTNQNSLFRSRDWLSANQGRVFPGPVGSWLVTGNDIPPGRAVWAFETSSLAMALKIGTIGEQRVKRWRVRTAAIHCRALWIAVYFLSFLFSQKRTFKVGFSHAQIFCMPFTC